MDTRVLLSKVLLLIYRTREIGLKGYEDLIANSLNGVVLENNDEMFIGSNKTKRFIEFLIDLNLSGEVLNKDTFIPTIELLLDNDPPLLNVVRKSIMKDHTEEEIKKQVVSLAGEIREFTIERKASELLFKATSQLRFHRGKVGSFRDFLRTLVGEIEPYTGTGGDIKDPAIVKEVDISNIDDVQEVFDEVVSRSDGTGVYRSGFQRVNTMLQGGFRPGDFVTVGALNHKYKTGLSNTFFAQIARYNTPIMYEGEEDLRPLAVRISTEDPLENNLQFMFQNLKANEGQFIKGKMLTQIDTKVMAQYVSKELTKNDFGMKFLRVDPSEWGFADLFNYVINLESQGYVVKIMMVDYLTMLSKKGCSGNANGEDLRDLLRRVRNFMSARKILFITPLQLSTEAHGRIAAGTPDHAFLKEIAPLALYSGSKQLAQEIDLELFSHLIKHNGRTFLHIFRGKHRIPTVLEREEDYSALYAFPEPNIPVLDDINGEDTGFSKLPRGGAEGEGFVGGGSDFGDGASGGGYLEALMI